MITTSELTAVMRDAGHDSVRPASTTNHGPRES
jgi:hypothetical protein